MWVTYQQPKQWANSWTETMIRAKPSVKYSGPDLNEASTLVILIKAF